MKARTRKLAWLLSATMVFTSVNPGMMAMASEENEVIEQTTEEAADPVVEEEAATEEALEEAEVPEDVELEEEITVAEEEVAEEQLLGEEPAQTYAEPEAVNDGISTQELDYSLEDTYTEVAVIPGGSIEIEPNVSSSLEDDKLTYSWSKYNEDTEKYDDLEKTTSKITVSNVTVTTLYRCEVSDGEETQRFTFKVIPTTQLEVEESEYYITVKPGQPAKMSAKATTNYGEVRYQWQIWSVDQNGQWDFIDIPDATAAEYEVQNVMKSAYYRCVVTDEYSTCYVEHEIEIDSGLKVSGGYFSRYFVGLGQNCSLEVNATTEYGTLSYQWKKWDETEKVYKDLEGATSSSYTVSNVQKKESYVCKITNGFEEREKQFDVGVESGLKVIEYDEPLRIKKGQTTTLKVEATSNYPLQYQWYRGVSDGDEPEKIEGATDATLEVTKSQYYGDNYFCKVWDPYNSADVDITVLLDTGFSVSADTMVWVSRGETAELKVNAATYEEYGPLNYEWHVLGEDKGWKYLDEVTGDTCTVKNVTNFQTYLCKISNKYDYEELLIMVGPKEEKDSAALTKENAKTLDENAANTVTIPTGNAEMYFKFVPSKSGIWEIYSESSQDTVVRLYDADGLFLGYDDDNDEADEADRNEEDDYNFHLRRELNEGATYYIVCGYNSYNEKGTYQVRAEYVGAGSHTHQWDAGRVTKEPTCVSAGTKVFTCSICGYEYNTPISATGVHSFGNYVETTHPTALAEGVQTRTCTVCGYVEQTAVGKLAANVTLSASTLPLQVKQSASLSKLITAITAGDRLVSCTTSNKKIATVSNAGKVTGKKAGTAKITMKFASGLSKTVTVKVQKAKVATSKITNVPGSITLKVKGSYKLSPVIAPITTKDKATYKTANKKIATVAKNGKITAKKAGKTTITVKVGKKTKKVKVSVTK